MRWVVVDWVAEVIKVYRDEKDAEAYILRSSHPKYIEIIDTEKEYEYRESSQ